MCSHNATSGSGAWRDVPQMEIGSFIPATICFSAQHYSAWHSGSCISCLKWPRSGLATLVSPKMSLDASARSRRPPRRVRSRYNPRRSRRPQARMRKLARRSRCVLTVSPTFYGAPAAAYTTRMDRYERFAWGIGRGTVRRSTCLVASSVLILMDMRAVKSV